MTEKLVFSMSSIGKCARTLCLEYIDPQSKPPTPEYLRLAAREGMRHEQFIKEDLLEHDWLSLTLGKPAEYCAKCDRYGSHVEFEADSFVLRGHTDDYLAHKSSDPSDDTWRKVTHFAEYKALGRFTCDKLIKEGLEKHRTYSMQFSAYSHMTGLPGVYAIKNRDTGKMNVELKEPQYAMGDILARCTVLQSAIVREEILPCDAEPGGIDTWGCTKACNNADPVVILPESITKYVSDLRQAKMLESVVKSLKTEAQQMLLAFMNASGRTKLVEDDMLISLVAEGIRKSYAVPDEIKKNYVVESPRAAYIRSTDRREE